MFYVYEWYVLETDEIFYVGKGCGNRYLNTSKRNKLFRFYFENFDCKSRIVKEFDTEDKAFVYEHERILELKSLGQAKCNLDYGGKGGVHFCWTDEMRKYKSEYNPMKAVVQRERMKTNNPMKNSEVSERVASKLRKRVVLNGIEYKSVKEASVVTGHREYTIIKWCKRGYDFDGNPCRYADETQKEIPLVRQLHPHSASPKAVIVDGVRYETVQDGAKAIGTWSESIIRAIKENRKCKGHTCQYANQQPSRGNSDKSTSEGSTTNG